MPSGLLDLPLEIRDQIWDHVIDCDKIHKIRFKSWGFRQGHYPIVFPWSSIVAVNRRCHKEIFDNLRRKGRFLRFRAAGFHVGGLTVPHLRTTLAQLAGNAFFSKRIKSLLLERCTIQDVHSDMLDCPDLTTEDAEEIIKASHDLCARQLRKSSTAMSQTTYKIWVKTEEETEDSPCAIAAGMEFTFI